MKNATMFTGLVLSILMATTANAKSAKNSVSIEKQGSVVEITIQGQAAKDLFDALEAPARGELGFVQIVSKQAGNILCQSLVGASDTAQMPPATYSCTIDNPVR